MNWDITNPNRKADSIFSSEPLTITGIKATKFRFRTGEQDCYSIEVKEDVTYPNILNVEETTKKEINTLRRTRKNRNELSDDRNNNDAFYYFIHHFRSKNGVKIPFKGYWINEEFTEVVFCLGEEANEIIREEKERWDNARFTKEEDLKLENIELVDAKWNALEKDIDGKNWNPSLNETEKELVNDASTKEGVRTAQRKIALLRNNNQTSKIEELKKQLAEKEKQINKLKNELEAANKKSQNQEEITKLKEEIDELNSESTKLVIKNSRLTSDMGDKERKIRELEDEIKELKKKLAESKNDQEVAQLKTEIASLKKQKEEIQQELEQSKKDKEKLEKDYQQEKEKREQNEEKLNDYKKEIEDLKKQLDAYKQGLSKTEKELQEKIKQKQKELLELEKKIADLEKNERDYQKQIEDLKQALVNADEEKGKLQAQLAQKEGELAQVKQRLESYREQVRELRADIDKLQDEFKDQRNKLSQELKDLKDKNEKLETKIFELSAELTNTGNERDEFKRKLDNAKVEIEDLKKQIEDNKNAQQKLDAVQKKLEEQEQENEKKTAQLLDIKKKDLNFRLDNFRINLKVKESDLQTKYGSHNYQQILAGSLTLNNLEQLENTIQAVICICATEAISQEVANASKKANPDEIHAFLTRLNSIKTAWSQTVPEISKENNSLYLEIIDRQSDYRQQVDNLIKTLQEQQGQQLPQISPLNEVIEQAKKAKSINELEASVNSLDFYRNSQDPEIKTIYEQRKQEIDQLRNLLALKLQLTRHLEEAVDVSQDSKDGQEDIFKKRHLARSNLENFAELTSSEAKQAYQEVNQDSKVTNCIEKLAKKLWNYLEENEKNANDPSNKEFLDALISRGYTESTEKYKLYWIMQRIYQEFVKSHLDDKKHVKFYPYVTVPNTYGHTSPKKRIRTTTNSTGKVISSTVSLEGFDLYVDFKRPELQIFVTFVHELAHNVMYLKEHKGLLSGDQSHSKPFWESNYANIDSNLAYLLSCLPPEKQKELKKTADLSTNPDTDGLHTAYCLEGGELKGKARIRKYFPEEEINKEWNSTRQLALGIHNTSMNENLNNWELENRSEADKRWIKVVAYHKSKKPSIKDLEQGKYEYKIYIFFDDTIAPDTFTKSIRDAFGPESGWEGWKLEEEISREGGSAHIIDADQAERRLCKKIKEAEIKCGCGKEEHISTEIPQQEAQIIHNPFPMVNPNK